MWKPLDLKIAKTICYGCNSKISKQSYSYLQVMMYRNPDKIWSEIYEDKGFYFAIRCKKHVRLIEIAVHADYKKQGIGKKMLFRLLQRMQYVGIHRLTFRTPIDEDAQYFWLHLGACILDIKNNDYEMEIKIKTD